MTSHNNRIVLVRFTDEPAGLLINHFLYKARNIAKTGQMINRMTLNTRKQSSERVLIVQIVSYDQTVGDLQWVHESVTSIFLYVVIIITTA